MVFIEAMSMPRCDSACQARRLRMYIIYLCILLICVVLALCHFLIHLLGRRKSKEEARDYYQKRESIAAISFQPAIPTTTTFEAVQDDIKITTDGVSDLRIEMTEVNDGPTPSPSTSNFVGNHNHRPLQKIPEEQDERKIVEVEVHSENVYQYRPEDGPKYSNSSSMETAMISLPVSVAVATVSATVAEQSSNYLRSYHQNGISNDPYFGGMGIGNISRPSSSVSCFDISDIVNSPENAKRFLQDKARTC